MIWVKPRVFSGFKGKNPCETLGFFMSCCCWQSPQLKVKNPSKSLSEIKRVLKPQGRRLVRLWGRVFFFFFSGVSFVLGLF